MALTRPSRCRRKFLEVFPGGFKDPTYLDWERDYKWATHKRWLAALGQPEFARLLEAGECREIAVRAIRVEQQSRHSMIFSFEKMALRDAVKSVDGAWRFARSPGSVVYTFQDFADIAESKTKATMLPSKRRRRSYDQVFTLQKASGIAALFEAFAYMIGFRIMASAGIRWQLLRLASHS